MCNRENRQVIWYSYFEDDIQDLPSASVDANRSSPDFGYSYEYDNKLLTYQHYDSAYLKRF